MQVDKLRLFAKFGADAVGDVVDGQCADPGEPPNCAFDLVMECPEACGAREQRSCLLQFSFGRLKDCHWNAVLVWMTFLTGQPVAKRGVINRVF